MLFQLLLPVAAICLVLAILKVNIDPSSPTITLDFTSMLQRDPVIVANAPLGLAPCIIKGAPSDRPDTGPCGSALHFRHAPSLAAFACSNGSDMFVCRVYLPSRSIPACRGGKVPAARLVHLLFRSGHSEGEALWGKNNLNSSINIVRRL